MASRLVLHYPYCACLSQYLVDFDKTKNVEEFTVAPLLHLFLHCTRYKRVRSDFAGQARMGASDRYTAICKTWGRPRLFMDDVRASLPTTLRNSSRAISTNQHKKHGHHVWANNLNGHNLCRICCICCLWDSYHDAHWPAKETKWIRIQRQDCWLLLPCHLCNNDKHNRLPVHSDRKEKESMPSRLRFLCEREKNPLHDSLLLQPDVFNSSLLGL